jgi:WS/DGAT/MGAT family acyltransferase
MDRLTAHDLSMLWPDEVGWPQDIGALAVLDGGALLDPDAEIRIGAVRGTIEARLHLVPRFRQLIHTPGRGLGWPLWIDAPGFDVRDHVQVAPVAEPGDEASLLRAVERLRRQPLDRSRPLWRMWLLPRLAGGRIVLYMRVHHAIADGASGVAALGAFLDPEPTPVATSVLPWTPMDPPSSRDLLADNLRRRRDEVACAASALARPVSTVRRVLHGWPAVRETLVAGGAPRTSLNRPIGPGRKFGLVRGDLAAIRRVGGGHDATVNDVLMAAVAGGLRDLLRSRGETVDGVELRAYVPVSLHHGRPGPAHGNRDGVMAVPLPIGLSDPTDRLRRIAAVTAERKRIHRPPAGTLLRNGAVQRAFLRLMANQRWANMYIANVPGPPVPLWFAGAPVVEVFPVVPLTGNITLGVGALSYAGQFNITAVADEDACPDVDVFAAGVRSALGLMTGAGGLREPARGGHRARVPV